MRNSNRFFVLGLVLCVVYGTLNFHDSFVFAATSETLSSAVASPASACDAKKAAQVMGADFLWSGECREGLPEGRGVATFSDGRLFAGELAAGLFTGNGTLTLPGGERYTGEFAAGLFQGQGVYTFANGDRYVGEFQAGLMHGTGIVRQKGHEERYRAEYVNGERVKFEVEVQAVALLQEPVLEGVIPEVLRRLAKVNQYIRGSLGLQPTYTSGLRDPAKNGAVGGVLHSLHLSGRAVDLVVDGITQPQEELVATYADQQGLWALWHGEGDNYHLHLQWNEE